MAQDRGMAKEKRDPDVSAFGERLKQGYKAARVSGSDLAVLAGLRQPQVSKLVKGHTGLETPGFLRLVRAALESGIAAEWLFLSQEPKARPRTDPGFRDRIEAIRAQRLVEEADEEERKRKVKLAEAKARLKRSRKTNRAT